MEIVDISEDSKASSGIEIISNSAVANEHDTKKWTETDSELAETPNSSASTHSKLDRWGFIVDKEAAELQPKYLETNIQSKINHVESREERRRRIRVEQENLLQWQIFLRSWDKSPTLKPRKLKKLCRKGVPEELRAKVWMRLAGADIHKIRNPNLYKELIARGEKSEDYEYIIRDIDRTLPSHSMFQEKGGLGQEALLNVLNAYAIHNNDVGYCQGMGFITAMFLSYMPAEDAFYMLSTVVENDPFKLNGLYRRDMFKSRVMIDTVECLLPQFFPKLSKHLKSEEVNPNMFITSWIVCLFTTGFPFELSVRFWDIFLNEGWKITFRFILAILKREKRHLKTLHFENILLYLRTSPVRVVGNNVEKLVTDALSLSFTSKQLKKAMRVAELSVRKHIDDMER